MKGKSWTMALAGICAGSISGLFGAGGGMVLVPLLILLSDLEEQEIFTASLAVILPICIIGLIMGKTLPTFSAALPYLLGSAVGGFLAAKLAGKIPVLWLHRGLGLLILWGGVRNLC